MGGASEHLQGGATAESAGLRVPRLIRTERSQRLGGGVELVREGVTSRGMLKILISVTEGSSFFLVPLIH